MSFVKLLGAVFGMLAIIGGIIALIGAWLTHVVWAIMTLAGVAGVTFGQLLLMFFGTFFPPVGVIHGILLWTGHGF